MPVDPKYAGLPGIAYDQPDIFQTVEGEGDDESNENTDTESDDNERLHMSSLSWIGDMEVGVDQGEKETLLQRFMRIRCEIGELQEEIDCMTESARESSHSDGLSIQVQSLSKQLESCQLENGNTGSGGIIGVDALSKQIDALKAAGSGKKSENNEGVYQVFLGNEKNASVDVASLDKRLAALENVVGCTSASDSKVLSAQTDSQNLSKSIRILEDRKALLKPQHIDHVEGRLSALTFKINSISEQKTSVEAATKDDKLNKLASLVSGQSSMATAVLPEVLERMEAVAALQDDSKTWSDIVDTVQQQQRETKDVIKDTQKSLIESREFFDKNITGIYDKCNLLQSNLGEIKSS